MMKMNVQAKPVIGFLLLLFLSTVFTYSGLSKFNSIEPFEWSFMDMGFSGQLSFILARFLIGFELVLAAFMLGHFYLRKITYPITITFLIVMTIYLVVLLITKGNDVDCGCFGDDLPMTPVQSIIKNVVLIAICLVLQRIYAVKGWKYQVVVAPIVTVILWVLPFVFVPYTQQPGPIDLSFLYKHPTVQPDIDLQKGKHLVAFVSLGCPHCRHAAGVFAEMMKEDATLPIYMVMLGQSEDTAAFFEETKAGHVPHIVTNDVDGFKSIAGKYVPQIYWIKDGVKERRVTYVQLKTSLLKSWSNY